MKNESQSSGNYKHSKEKKALFFPKGRNVSAEDCEVVQQIIGKQPYKRDMLIEYLHAIQDQEGHLS